MELPVPFTPGFRFRIFFERLLELPQYVFGAAEILVTEVGNGLAEHVALEDRARFEKLRNLLGRQRRNHGAAIRHDCDQPFGSEMAQRFANRDAADLKFGGNRVLTQLFALAQFAAENLLANPLDDGRGQRLARNRRALFGNGRFGRADRPFDLVVALTRLRAHDSVRNLGWEAMALMRPISRISTRASARIIYHNGFCVNSPSTIRQMPSGFAS